MNPRSEEIAYLKRLIKDFPANIELNDVSRAFNLIAARYQVIEQSYKTLSLTKSEIESPDTNFISLFKFRVSVLHEYLFEGILSNAGEFRKSSDPEGGRIGFGGLKHQGQQSKFRGTAPSKIEEELDEVLSNLDYKAESPINNALRFYQQFVYIHPFYDANGRIGRVLVSMYLLHFNLYVQWSEFDGANNGKFIRKLNKCHKRKKNKHGFERYFNYLLDFFKDYVVTIDELSNLK